MAVSMLPGIQYQQPQVAAAPQVGAAPGAPFLGNPSGITSAVNAGIGAIGSGGPLSAFDAAMYQSLISQGYSPQQAQQLISSGNSGYGTQNPGFNMQNAGGGNTGGYLNQFTNPMDALLSQWNTQNTASAAPAQQAATQQNLTPTYLSSQLPGGQVPQTTPATVGNIPSIDPSFLIGSAEAYNLPLFQQQDQAMQEALANAGIVGGSTGAALANLGTQQQTTLGQNIAPYVFQGAAANQNAALNAGTFNASQLNAGQQFDINNLINAAIFQANQGTNAGLNAANMANQDWLAQLGATGQLAQAGMGVQAGAFNPIYAQPSATNLGGIASAFAPNPTYNLNVPSYTPSPTYTPGGSTPGGTGAGTGADTSWMGYV